MASSAWTFFPSQFTVTTVPSFKSIFFSMISRVEAIPIFCTRHLGVSCWFPYTVVLQLKLFRNKLSQLIMSYTLTQLGHASKTLMK